MADEAIWREPHFIDLFADAYLPESYDAAEWRPDYDTIGESLGFVAQMLRSGMPSENSKTSVLAKAVADGFESARAIHAAIPYGKSDESGMLRAVQTIVEHISALQPGGVTAVPGGWCAPRAGRDRAAPPGGRRVLLVVRRETEDPELLTLVLVNVGGGGGDAEGHGLQYHPKRAAPEAGKTRCAAGLPLRGVPRAKARSAWPWFLLLRPLVWPPAGGAKGLLETDPAKALYEKLLPFFNARPLKASIGAAAAAGALDFRTLPRGRDGSRARLVLEAAFHALRLAGCGVGDAKRLLLGVREAACRAALAALAAVDRLPAGDAETLRLARRNLAAAAGRHAQSGAPGAAAAATAARELVGSLGRRVDELLRQEPEGRAPGPLALAAGALRQPPGAAAFPGFGRLRRDAGVEALAGPVGPDPLIRPVELTLVPDGVSTHRDAQKALKDAVELCVLLDNQSSDLKNTYCLRTSLIHHLFTTVLPAPLPCTHPERDTLCFWRKEPMRYETQHHFLMLLHQVVTQYAAASMAIVPNRSFDAARLTAMAAAAAVADAVLRVRASDGLDSDFVLHYNGWIPGPVKPFGFDAGLYAEESEWSTITDPHLTHTRSKILEYFHAQTAAIDEDHMLFNFDSSMRMGAAETALMTQLAITKGFRMDLLPQYLAGENPALLASYPELSIFRDIVFLFKAMLSPYSDQLPEVRRWKPEDATLTWKWSGNKDDKKAKFVVTGFGGPLKCAAWERPEDRGNRGLLKGMLRAVGLDKKPRVPPTQADPSVLVQEEVNTEEDILHVRYLPDFEGALRQSDSELLLQYLTAPYLRVPLVLQFFSASPVKVRALRSGALRAVVDACLFEPGPWAPPGGPAAAAAAAAPPTIPGPDRSALATPAGLLFNELVKSPEATLRALEGLLDTAMELDPGRYTAGSGAVILFAVRLVVKVEGFALFLLDEQEQGGAGGLRRAARPGVVPLLRAWRTRVRRRLDGDVFPMLERWFGKALKKQQLGAANILMAHLAHLYRNITPRDLDFRVVSTMVCAQVFLTINFRYDLEAPKTGSAKGSSASSDDLLLMPQFELFGIFTKHRHKIMGFLNENPEVANDVMEAVVRVATFTGTRAGGGGGGGGASSPGGGGGPGLGARRWARFPGHGRAGYFVPDTEVAPGLARLRAAPADRGYAAWLRETCAAVGETEADLQLGNFTLKKRAFDPVDPEILRRPEFQEVFAGTEAARSGQVQAATIAVTDARAWVRLVGLRHDLQFWPQADARTPACPFDRKAGGGSLGGGYRGDEAWVAALWAPLQATHFPRCSFFLPGESQGPLAVARLAGYDHNHPYNLPGRNGPDGKPQDFYPLKEVFVYKEQGLVQVFDVFEVGRRFYRCAVFSNQASASFASLEGRRPDWVGEGPLVPCGDTKTTAVKPGPTLAITRNLFARVGEQMRVPSQALQGLLPAALLEAYRFWQNDDDSLTGYTLAAGAKSAARGKDPTLLHIKLVPTSDKDESGQGISTASAIIRRWKVPDELEELEDEQDGQQEAKEEEGGKDDNGQHGEEEGDEEGASTTGGRAFGEIGVRFQRPSADDEEVMTLLNPLLAPQGTALRQVADLMMRVETAAHTLYWARESAAGDDALEAQYGVDLVELPRLGLTFRVEAGGEGGGAAKLFCVEHRGLWVCTGDETPTLAALGMAGLPHSLLLEAADRSLSLVLPATAVPHRVAEPGCLWSTRILPNPASGAWLSNLGSVKHHVYPIHPSRTYARAPTLAGALTLLVLHFLNRNYPQVCSLMASCLTDNPPTKEEAQIFAHLKHFAEDAHPDAHAARLRLWLGFAGTPLECPWDVAQEAKAYVLKRAHVSAACRLTPQEEEQVLSAVDIHSSPEATTRLRLLKAISQHEGAGESKQDTDSSAAIEVVLPTFKDFKEYDSFVDKSCVENDIMAQAKNFGGLFNNVMYTKPEASGIQAVRQLNSALSNWRLSGGGTNLGFLFVYDLLSANIRFTLLPNDEPQYLGALLTRMLPDLSTHDENNMLTSMLRLMENNPDLSRSMPKYVDRRNKLMKMVGAHNLQKHLEDVGQWLGERRGQIQWPEPSPRESWGLQQPISQFRVPNSLVELMAQERAWIAPRAADFSCDGRLLRPVVVDKKNISTASDLATFTDAQMLQFSDQPLGHMSKWWTVKTGGFDGMPAPSSSMPFEVSHHPEAKSYVANEMNERNKQDMQYYSSEFPNKENFFLAGFSESEVRSLTSGGGSTSTAIKKVDDLIADLHAQRQEDFNYMRSCFVSSEAVANEVQLPEEGTGGAQASQLGHLLLQAAGREPELKAEDLLAQVLSTRCEDDLRLIQPFGTRPSVAMDLLVAGLLASSRLDQVARCLGLAQQLRGLLVRLSPEQSTKPSRLSRLTSRRKKKKGNDDAENAYYGVLLTSSTLAMFLATRRHYIEKQQSAEKKGRLSRLMQRGGNVMAYDPRFLITEFTGNMILRASQVELINKFMDKYQSGGSLCHQMIMGAGKTTVVGPVLSLMLGDGKTFVMQVMPAALLEMSRSVLRDRFSAVMQKPVYTFRFDRGAPIDDALVGRLRRAAAARAVVVTDPASLKSFALKFVEIMHELNEDAHAGAVGEAAQSDNAALAFIGQLGQQVARLAGQAKAAVLGAAGREALLEEARRCSQIMALFRDGALIMDEVDLILHPLKSELNWPIGPKLPLDFTQGSDPGSSGLRWNVPWHLLDAVLFFGTGQMSVEFHDSREAALLLQQVRAQFQRGVELKMAQTQPHLVLLNRDFYTENVLPLLARWMLLYVRHINMNGVTDQQVLDFLTRPRSSPGSRETAARLEDGHVKMLNLAFEWIHFLVPFVVSSIDRVKFGLLSEEYLAAALAKNPRMSRSRKLLAVPFVGKDVPSKASEFSQPDIVIGMTTLAYRYEGLRRKDFAEVLRALRAQMEDEPGPFRERASSVRYAEWVRLSGGRVRGHKYGDRGTRPCPPIRPEFEDVLPLFLLDFGDREVMDSLYALLAKQPVLVHYWLNEFVFPQTMAFQELKLSANGQDLGGDLLFPRRLGFSGTPSSLLPVELGGCVFQPGDTADMTHTLTSPRVAGARRMPDGWTVESLLREVADARRGYKALIDTGALITGYDNKQVARYLLDHGLEGMAGCVYLDEADRKMVLLRQGYKVLTLEQANLPLDQRFTFYDQIHTTGMDIHQALTARAAITLGKDMTFRDFAQGAYRMRGIGKGQSIELIIIPEVEKLVLREMALGEGISEDRKEKGSLGKRDGDVEQTLRDVCGWLTINSMRSERKQFSLLSEQSLKNVWRKEAYRTLLKAPENHADDSGNLCVDVFRERVDYTVSNFGGEPQRFEEKLQQMVDANTQLVRTDGQKETIMGILNKLTDPDQDNRDGKSLVDQFADDFEKDYETEQVQENEQEEEQEKEQEQEQEHEDEKEEEREELAEDEPSPQNYARDDEAPRAWPLAGLALPPAPENQGFYSGSEFAVTRLTQRGTTIALPDFVCISHNYYKKSWNLQPRRLKNVIVYLDYIPDCEALTVTSADEEGEGAGAGEEKEGQARPPTPTASPSPLLRPAEDLFGQHKSRQSRRVSLLLQKEQSVVRRTFDMFDLDSNGQLSKEEMLEVLRSLDVDARELKDHLEELFSAADADGSGGVSFAEMRAAISHQSYMRLEAGRHYVALSLPEAEHLRAALHAAQGGPLLPGSPGAQCALRVSATSAGGGILDGTDGYVAASEYQTCVAGQVLKFVDSQLKFSEREGTILLRCLEVNTPDHRRRFFDEVRASRRRPQIPVEKTAVGRIVKTDNELSILEYRATVLRVKALARERGYYILDMFQLWNVSKTGMMTCTELYSGMVWLGMTELENDENKVHLIHTLVENINIDGDGYINYVEFKTAFFDPEKDRELLAVDSGAACAVGGLAGVAVPQKPIPELFQEDAPKALVAVPTHRVSSFRVQKCEFTSFKKGWTSKKTSARKKVSIWHADTGTNIFERNKIRISFGDFAVKDFKDPRKVSPRQPCFGVELTDTKKLGIRSSEYLSGIADKVFPHPVRYKQVWKQQPAAGKDTKGSSVFIWKPVPPTPEFIALGLVITTTDAPPELSETRCLKRKYAVAERSAPEYIWDDSGTGGRPGSLWLANSLGLFATAQGHHKPQETFWTLASDDFKIEAEDIKDN